MLNFWHRDEIMSENFNSPGVSSGRDGTIVTVLKYCLRLAPANLWAVGHCGLQAIAGYFDFTMWI